MLRSSKEAGSTELWGRFLKAYGLAVLGVAGATLLRVPLEPVLHGRAPYALYYLPILWMAWYGRVGPTIVAIVLSLAASWAFVVPTSELGYPATVALFLVVSIAMVLMANAARVMRDRSSYLASIVESSDDAIVHAGPVRGGDDGRRHPSSAVHLEPSLERDQVHASGWPRGDHLGDGRDRISR